MKEGEGGGQIDSAPEKATLKKPNLIRVKQTRKSLNFLMFYMLTKDTRRLCKT